MQEDQQRHPEVYSGSYRPTDHVPEGERFAAQIMIMAEGDDDRFDRYMHAMPLREVYRRNALRVAQSWRPLPETTT